VLKKEKASLAFMVSLIGAVLIFINGILIAMNSGPIILTTDAGLATVDAVNNFRGFWGRISFGLKGMVEGQATPLWLIFTVVLLGCVIQIYRRPRRHRIYAYPIILLSFLSLPIGGGFFIGFILAFVGGMVALEWPKPFRDTFFGRMVRTARLDSKIPSELANDYYAMRAGFLALAFTSISMGLGNAIYISNVNIIQTQPSVANQILFQGLLKVDINSLLNAISFLGVTFLRWILVSSIIYIIASKLKGYGTDFGKLSCAIAFALVPLSLQVFLPVLFSNTPHLLIHWPLSIVLISTLWAAVAIVVVIGSIFGFSKREALGVTIFVGVMYWLVDNVLISSNPLTQISGVTFKITADSASLVVLLISIATLIAFLLGAFSTRQDK